MTTIRDFVPAQPVPRTTVLRTQFWHELCDAQTSGRRQIAEGGVVTALRLTTAYKLGPITHTARGRLLLPVEARFCPDAGGRPWERRAVLSLALGDHLADIAWTSPADAGAKHAAMILSREPAAIDFEARIFLDRGSLKATATVNAPTLADHHLTLSVDAFDCRFFWETPDEQTIVSPGRLEALRSGNAVSLVRATAVIRNAHPEVDREHRLSVIVDGTPVMALVTALDAEDEVLAYCNDLVEMINRAKAFAHARNPRA